MSNFNQYNEVDNPAVVLIGEETFSFYANLDDLESDTNFSNWHLDLVNSDFDIVVQDIGTLNQDFINGSEYRFYSKFTIPAGLTSGCYYFVINDEFYNLVKYISNKVYYKTSLDYTKKVRYRNDKNILNYNYEILTDLYNEFRIQLATRRAENDVTQTGYDLSSGVFNPVRSIIGKTKEFITLWYDDFDHEAFQSATIHKNFEVVDLNQWIRFVRNSDYDIDWQDNYPLAEGTIRLQNRGTYSSNKTQ